METYEKIESAELCCTSVVCKVRTMCALWTNARPRSVGRYAPTALHGMGCDAYEGGRSSEVTAAMRSTRGGKGGWS